MERKIKKISESKAEQVQIVLYSDTNSSGRLFGGQLMQWIDIVATVVARRHAECEVTTVAVDHLNFMEASYVGDTVILRGHITYVGKTSMEVKVDTYSESLKGKRRHVNRAYFVMVGLDKEGNPCVVPSLELVTEEEKREWEEAQKRSKLRK